MGLQHPTTAPKGSDTATPARAIAVDSARGLPPSLIAAWIAVAVLLCVAFPIAMMVVDREHIVGFVADDAYYYFNVAQRIAAGEGPTADGLTRTTGFHPLYAFTLAALHRLTNPTLDGFVAQAVAVNAIGSILAGVFLGLAARRWWGRTAGWTAALLWWCNPHSAHIVADGLEGGVYACTLALFLWLAQIVYHAVADGSYGSSPHAGVPIKGSRVLGQAVALGVAASLAVLSRTDALVILGLICLVIGILARDRRLGLAVTAVVVLFVAVSLSLWWWYCWSYTGSIVQGSAAVKREWNAFLREQQGPMAWAYAFGEWMNYAVKCVFKVPALKWVWIGAPALIVLWRTAPRPGRWMVYAHVLSPLLLGGAYCLLLDRPRTWYYVPALTIFTLLAAGAVEFVVRNVDLHSTAWARRFRSLVPYVVLGECVGLFVSQDARFLWKTSDQVQGVRAAQWLDENLPADARVGCWHSGIVQYYTPRVNVINLDGLANNDILAVLREKKSMNDYWDEMRITHILGGPRVKMGGYEKHWNGKRLETCGFGGKLQCVVEDVPDATAK